MLNDDALYYPAPFFMARTPMFSIEDFFSPFKKKEINQSLLNSFTVDQLDLLREALAIASPELYKAIACNKINEQTISSIFKYFSRMATRGTPFGLFSFVSIGTWDASNSAIFDLGEVRKRVRPDMEWLSLVIDQICNDSRFIPLLYVQTNPLLYEWGERICLNYVRKKNLEEKTETISIRSSFLTLEIFALTKEPIALNDLIDKVIQQHPTLDKEKLQNMLLQLLKQQLLNFTLLPTLLTESPFANLLSKLPFAHEALNEIAAKMQDYNHCPLGLGETSLQDIQKGMEALASSKNLIQVDAAYIHDQMTLSHEIAKEIQEGIEVLWNISQASSSDEYPLKSYHEKFLEKYGTYRIVPLHELLHNEAGIGIPEHYLNINETKSKDVKESKWKNWLRLQWIRCLRENSNEIEITEEVLKENFEKLDSKKAPLSFDLFCEVIGDSASDVNHDNFLILAKSIASQGGATFGRFLDMLGEPMKDALKAFLVDEEDLEKDNVFAESSYFSHLSRNANVSIQPKLRKNSIDISGIGNIHLNDIYVGTTLERFYLTLKNQTKELIVTSGNMLNSTTAPHPIRFIREVSNNRYKPIFTFSWMDLGNSPFLPRVRYKRMILKCAQWRVDLFQLGLTSKATQENIRKKFIEWSQEWKLPRYCFIGEGDNLFLLDLEQDVNVNEVTSRLKKNQSVSFFEKINQEKGQWTQSQRGTHLSEFVIPFIKNAKYAGSPQIKFPKEIAIASKSRLKLPGSEWLYAKIYLGTDQENRFLTEYCYPFVEFLLQQQIIKEWFFVRYSDSKTHVRLRFKGVKEDITSKLLPILHDWAHDLIQRKCIQDLTLSGYDREMERYGGKELIEAAESLFHADSVTTISLVSLILNKKNSIPEEIISALSIIDLLKGFGMNLGEQLDFFSMHMIEKEELKGFREHKTSLLSLSEAILLDVHSEKSNLLQESFEKRKDNLRSFAEKMKDIENRGELLSTPHNIYSSIIHMHCNRLIGRDGKKEKKARVFAYHALTLLKEKMKHMKPQLCTF